MNIIDKLNLILDQKQQLSAVIAKFGGQSVPFTQYAQQFELQENNLRESIQDIKDQIDEGAILQMDQFINVLSNAFSNIVATDFTDENVSQTISNLRNSVNVQFSSINKRIILWGDSLTNPSDYSNELQRLVSNGGNSHIVVNCGVGWNKSYEVAQRMGALTLNIKTPFIIPAELEFTPIEFEKFGGFLSVDLYSANNAQHGMINPVSIKGIEGTLSCISVQDAHITTGGYAFKRSEPGQQISVEYGAEMTTYGSKNLNDAGDIAVIFVGTNDKINNIDDVIEYTDMMVKNIKSGKYVIVGLESVSNYNLNDFNAAIEKQAKRYGKHYLNIYQLMRAYGIQYFTSNGGTITEELDAANQVFLSQGRIPACLYASKPTLDPPYDTTHFNAYGYKMIAQLVYDKGCALGYWM